MTIKELSNYSKIKQEIIQLQIRIKELEEYVKSNSIILFESQSNYKNTSELERRVTKIIELKDKLTYKLDLLVEQELDIEKFLDSIELEDIRIIIRKKFIENKSWKTVGKEIHSDRTTPYYKLKKYLERRNKDEKNIKII